MEGLIPMRKRKRRRGDVIDITALKQKSCEAAITMGGIAGGIVLGNYISGEMAIRKKKQNMVLEELYRSNQKGKKSKKKKRRHRK